MLNRPRNGYIPITEDRVIRLETHNGKEYCPRLQVFDVINNQHITDLFFEDYPIRGASEDYLTVIATSDQKRFVVLYWGCDKESKDVTVIKIFNISDFSCVTHVEGIFFATDYRPSIIDGQDLILFRPEEPERRCNLFCRKPQKLGEAMPTKQTLVKIPFLDDQLLPKDIVSMPYYGNSPRHFCVLKPNLLSEMRESGFTLYEIDKRVKHVIKFTSFLPKNVTLPKDKNDLRICYSPNGSQACLYYQAKTDETHNTHVEHFKLTKTWHGYYTFEHLASHILEEHVRCELFWAKNDILYAYYSIYSSRVAGELAVLNHTNQFSKTVLKQYDKFPDFIFTPHGRVIEIYPERFAYEYRTHEQIVKTIQVTVPCLPLPLTRLVADYDPKFFALEQPRVEEKISLSNSRCMSR